MAATQPESPQRSIRHVLTMVILCLAGVSISLVFWKALIKATRNWAPSEKQGRAFGFLEAGGISGSALM